MNTAGETVRSADGTMIAVERAGEGPPVILAGGAFNDRSTVAGLAAVLSADFTAVTYDRRGRGTSGDSGSYAAEREIEDLAAVIGYAGGRAGVFGHSSGAVLALEAAADGVEVAKVAAYEPSSATRPANRRLNHDQAAAYAVAAGTRYPVAGRARSWHERE